MDSGGWVFREGAEVVVAVGRVGDEKHPNRRSYRRKPEASERGEACSGLGLQPVSAKTIRLGDRFPSFVDLLEGEGPGGGGEQEVLGHLSSHPVRLLT